MSRDAAGIGMLTVRDVKFAMFALDEDMTHAVANSLLRMFRVEEAEAEHQAQLRRALARAQMSSVRSALFSLRSDAAAKREEAEQRARLYTAGSEGSPLPSPPHTPRASAAASPRASPLPCAALTPTGMRRVGSGRYLAGKGGGEHDTLFRERDAVTRATLFTGPTAPTVNGLFGGAGGGDATAPGEGDVAGIDVEARLAPSAPLRWRAFVQVRSAAVASHRPQPFRSAVCLLTRLPQWLHGQLYKPVLNFGLPHARGPSPALAGLRPDARGPCRRSARNIRAYSGAQEHGAPPRQPEGQGRGRGGQRALLTARRPTTQVSSPLPSFCRRGSVPL